MRQAVCQNTSWNSQIADLNVNFPEPRLTEPMPY